MQKKRVKPEQLPLSQRNGGETLQDVAGSGSVSGGKTLTIVTIFGIFKDVSCGRSLAGC